MRYDLEAKGKLGPRNTRASKCEKARGLPYVPSGNFVPVHTCVWLQNAPGVVQHSITVVGQREVAQR